MKVITLAKADPLGGQVVEGAVVNITGTIPPLDTLTEHQDWMDCQAQLLVAVLTDSLPQGVLDRVAAQLIRRLVTDYIGAMDTARELQPGNVEMMEWPPPDSGI